MSLILVEFWWNFGGILAEFWRIVAICMTIRIPQSLGKSDLFAVPSAKVASAASGSRGGEEGLRVLESEGAVCKG
jgi:hypothetical protein